MNDCSIYSIGLPAMLERMDRIVLERAYQTMPFLSLGEVMLSLIYLFRVGLTKCAIGIYSSAVSALNLSGG